MRGVFICRSSSTLCRARFIGNPSGALTHSRIVMMAANVTSAPAARVVAASGRTRSRSSNADARPVASTEAGWSLDASQVLALERVALEQTTP